MFVFLADSIIYELDIFTESDESDKFLNLESDIRKQTTHLSQTSDAESMITYEIPQKKNDPDQAQTF